MLTDRDAHCFYILTAYGQLLAHKGKLGTAPGDLHSPHGVALDKDGKIIISELGNHRISVFMPGGEFVYCFGYRGSDPGLFHCPRHLCFNHMGQLVVADEENQRLQLFDISNL